MANKYWQTLEEFTKNKKLKNLKKGGINTKHTQKPDVSMEEVPCQGKLVEPIKREQHPIIYN